MDMFIYVFYSSILFDECHDVAVTCQTVKSHIAKNKIFFQINVSFLLNYFYKYWFCWYYLYRNVAHLSETFIFYINCLDIYKKYFCPGRFRKYMQYTFSYRHTSDYSYIRVSKY